MKLLIYGAGVIGSLYGVLFEKAGFDVSVYARGDRLNVLRSKGLLYLENNTVKKSKAKVISELKEEDKYDFIFLAVRENQLYEALDELKENKSDIVTLVNSIDDYHNWESICGEGHILPAFPGAGGSIKNDVLDAALTPWIIQPTTFGEISGKKKDRTIKLSQIFKSAGIPYKQVPDMHLWQLCHLAMVVPIADAYYEADDPKEAGKEFKLMRKTAKRLKRNFRFLEKVNGKLSPGKLRVFLYAPTELLAVGLSFVFRSSFGDRFMYQHSIKAPDEMRELHKQFYTYVKNILQKTIPLI